MKIILHLLISFIGFNLWAAEPIVGNKAAEDYFKAREQSPEVQERKQKPSLQPSGSHMLSLRFGAYLDDEAYTWGNPNNSDVGSNEFGLGYQVGEWMDSTDYVINVSFSSFNLVEGTAQKMSIVPTVTFPDIKSGFPLYFGAGVGMGVFFKQIRGESSLSLDYALIAGGRFFNANRDLGIFIEGGLKNHLHLLSDGQFNGTYFNIGTIFIF